MMWLRGGPERGQVLVLVGVGMLFFLGVAGLVVDVGAAYSEQRHERAVADAAALAGVQELQRENSRLVGSAEYTQARTLAMQSLVNQLTPGAALPACGAGAPYGANVINCALPGSEYYVSVLAPAPSCLPNRCDRERSVQVSVRIPRFGLVLARLFNQFNWNVASTSVAELAYSPSYNMVVLRPPEPTRANDPRCRPDCDGNEGNVFLDGSGTTLTLTGDLGTNTNMTLASGQVVMPADRFAYHYDAYVNWSERPPIPRQLSSPILDPMYPIPSPTPVPASAIFADLAAAQHDPAACDNLRARVPAAYGIDPSWTSTEVLCFKKGVYNFRLGSGSAFSSNKAIILEPGVYFFNQGLNVGSNSILIGGFEADPNPGVAVVLPSGTGCNPGCDFDAESAKLVSLNAGSAFPSYVAASTAAAAVHFDGTRVQAPAQPTPIPMTLLVNKDTRCVVGITEPADCPTNTQLKLPGGANLYLAGIQYAASDNVSVKGGSGSTGYVGQLIVWTVHYTGGANVSLTMAGEEKPGIYRLATPCSPRAYCDAAYVGAAIP